MNKNNLKSDCHCWYFLKNPFFNSKWNKNSTESNFNKSRDNSKGNQKSTESSIANFLFAIQDGNQSTLPFTGKMFQQKEARKTKPNALHRDDESSNLGRMIKEGIVDVPAGIDVVAGGGFGQGLSINFFKFNDCDANK